MQDEINQVVDAERERCARLCEELARRWEARAAKLREDGSYKGRWLWRKSLPRIWKRRLVVCTPLSVVSVKVGRSNKGEMMGAGILRLEDVLGYGCYAGIASCLFTLAFRLLRGQR